MSVSASVTFTKNIDTKKATTDLLLKGIVESAYVVKAQAQSLAPVHYGQLRNSIEVGNIEKISARVGTNLEYGVYQEYGTRYMAAQPYLRPAVALTKGRNVNLVKAWLSVENFKGFLKRRIINI